MILNLKTLKQFIRYINKYPLNHVNVKNKNLDIIINNTKISKNTYSSRVSNISTITNQQNNKHKSSIYTKTATNNNLITNKIIQHDESKIYSTIISPMVGTFYRSPGPNEPAFIEKHDTVQKKQTVCIIEAMKLMNEIEAEVYGEVVEILVKDGDIVDCGQALMKVKT